MTLDIANDADLVAQGFQNRLSPDQTRIAEMGTHLTAMLIRKNIDYGSSAWKAPALAPGLDCGTAILVRMSDKIERLKKLLANPGTAMVAESADDTMRDLAGYMILYLARP